jgi:hypothetical protein
VSVCVCMCVCNVYIYVCIGVPYHRELLPLSVGTLDAAAAPFAAPPLQGQDTGVNGGVERGRLTFARRMLDDGSGRVQWWSPLLDNVVAPEASVEWQTSLESLHSHTSHTLVDSHTLPITLPKLRKRGGDKSDEEEEEDGGKRKKKRSIDKLAPPPPPPPPGTAELGSEQAAELGSGQGAERGSSRSGLLLPHPLASPIKFQSDAVAWWEFLDAKRLVSVHVYGSGHLRQQRLSGHLFLSTVLIRRHVQVCHIGMCTCVI